MGYRNDGWVRPCSHRREGVGDAERAQEAAPGARAPPRGGGGLVEAAEVAPAARSSPAGMYVCYCTTTTRSKVCRL